MEGEALADPGEKFTQSRFLPTDSAEEPQKETAQAICDKGADYVLTVKGNQPTLHEQIQKCFEDAGDNDYNVPGLRRLKKTERGHGRIERREYYVMPAPKSLRDTGGMG